MTIDPGHEAKELENEMVSCKTCEGMGLVDVGDPENGVVRSCPGCEGMGEIKWSDIPEVDLSLYESNLPAITEAKKKVA